MNQKWFKFGSWRYAESPGGGESPSCEDANSEALRGRLDRKKSGESRIGKKEPGRKLTRSRDKTPPQRTPLKPGQFPPSGVPTLPEKSYLQRAPICRYYCERMSPV